MPERVKKALLKMREELLKGINQNLKAERSNFEIEIGDFFDSADTERDRQLFHLLSGRERQKLEAIDDALERIADGTYGVCEECGKKIHKERLKIMPFTQHCVSCKSAIEKHTSMLKRDIQEEFTYKDVSVGEVEDADE